MTGGPREPSTGREALDRAADELAAVVSEGSDEPSPAETVHGAGAPVAPSDPDDVAPAPDRETPAGGGPAR